MIINGKVIESSDSVNIVNPYNKNVVGKVANSNENDIINSLTSSYETKFKLNTKQKIKILNDTAIYIKKNKDDFALMITSETGLCLKDSNYEVDRVINCAKYAAKCCDVINKDQSDKFIFDRVNQPKLKVITEPLDLVVAVTPFNHPMNQVAHKIFPALIAGAAVVLKPSEKTPLSAIMLVKALITNGLPNNMINVITGKNGKHLMQQILSFPKIDMITFTGGVNAGFDIKRNMIKHNHILTKYVPELGGSSSLIICNDADIENAIKVIINGCFKNTGQRCTSIRRVILDNNIDNNFIKKLLSAVEKIKYGDPFNIDNDMGTLIDEDAAKKIKNRVDIAISEGAKLIYGNKRVGALYSPTIIDNVNLKMELVAKETFGPVCPIIRTSSFEEALMIANDTRYKLAGGIMTSDNKKAEMASNFLQVGQFSFNGPPSYRTEVAPFGGFGDSGNGEKEGILLAAKGMQKIRTFYSH